LLDRYPVSYYEYSLSCFIVFHEYHYRSLKVSLLGQKTDNVSMDLVISVYGQRKSHGFLRGFGILSFT
jgi:hypothetical protein